MEGILLLQTSPPSLERSVLTLTDIRLSRDYVLWYKNVATFCLWLLLPFALLLTWNLGTIMALKRQREGKRRTSRRRACDDNEEVEKERDGRDDRDDDVVKDVSPSVKENNGNNFDPAKVSNPFSRCITQYSTVQYPSLDNPKTSALRLSVKIAFFDWLSELIFGSFCCSERWTRADNPPFGDRSSE